MSGKIPRRGTHQHPPQYARWQHLRAVVSIPSYDMIAFDSAAPMRIVLSFLVASHEKLLTHHLGSDRGEGKRERCQRGESE